MGTDDKFIRDLIAQASSGNTLTASQEAIIRKILRRRRVTLAYIASLGSVATCAALAIALLSSEDTSNRLAKQPLGALPATTPAKSGGHGPAHLEHERKFRCGQQIEGPLLLTSANGVRLSATQVHKTASGAPEVLATVSVDQPRTLIGTLGPTGLRLLILKDGAIVGGQDLPAQPITPTPGKPITAFGEPGQLISTSQHHPYQQRITTSPTQLCSPLRWTDPWTNPERSHYTLRLVMSADSFRTDLDKHIPDWQKDPLLIADTPLPPAQ